MVCALSEEKKELHWLREDLQTEEGEKTLLPSPHSKNHKKK